MNSLASAKNWCACGEWSSLRGKYRLGDFGRLARRFGSRLAVFAQYAPHRFFGGAPALGRIELRQLAQPGLDGCLALRHVLWERSFGREPLQQSRCRLLMAFAHLL